MATHQPDYYPPQGGGPQGGGGPVFGQQILLIGLIVLGGVLIYRTFFREGGSGLSGLFSGPEEVDLTYVPSDFKPNLDEESTLRILASPAQYRKEFDDLVYQFNLSLLYHTATRMGLPDSLQRQVEPLYQTHHEYLKTLYFNDFMALKDSTTTLYETFYQDNSNYAVQVFNEVAGKYTCFFITQVMATLLKTSNGKLMAAGKGVDSPCAIALKEGLQPMIDRLEKRADILDFSASRGLLKEKVRKGITELATYEIRDKKGLDKTLQYKLLGFNVSETNIQVEAISVLKAGFKLDQYFDVTFSPGKGLVFVTLPPPTVLSHEVYPRVDKLDVGFLAGVSGEDMNQNFNELRRYFYDDAVNNDQVLQKARLRADTVMQLIMGPIVKGMGRNYKLQVRFQDQMSATPAPQAPPAIKK